MCTKQDAGVQNEDSGLFPGARIWRQAGRVGLSFSGHLPRARHPRPPDATPVGATGLEARGILIVTGNSIISTLKKKF